VTIVSADWLIAEPGATPISDGAVRVVGHEIAEVGSRAALLAANPGDEHVAGAGCVLAPGFVNAHVHLYGVLAHGIPVRNAPTDFWSFLDDFWWPLVENALDQPMIVAATEHVVGELLRSGTTTFYDVLEAPNSLPGILPAQGEVVQRLGARGVLSFEATERMGAENGRQGLKENLDLIAAHPGTDPGELVSGLMCIHTTFTCSPAFIETAHGMARENGALLHAHVNEGTHEAERCVETHGMRTMELYDSLGVAGPGFLASQCVQLSDRERDLIAQRGVLVTHMPLSNCEVGGGIAPIPELADAGVTVGLGSDGYLNDMFDVMRGAFLIHKARRCDPQVMPAARVFAMATAGGAATLGMSERVGTLAPGLRADLQLISLETLPTAPTEHNLYDQLVLWRRGSDVQRVMVNGAWVVADRTLLTGDSERARARAAEEAARLWTAT